MATGVDRWRRSSHLGRRRYVDSHFSSGTIGAAWRTDQAVTADGTDAPQTRRADTQQESASDAWRDELQALQQRARSRSRRQRQKPRGALRAAVVTMVVVALGLAGLGLLAFLGTMHLASSSYADINRDLPSINQIASRETFKTAQFYDRKGTLLWEFYDPDGGRRTVVPLSEISQYLIDATLAAEDANFYYNPGIEPKGIARARLPEPHRAARSSRAPARSPSSSSRTCSSPKTSGTSDASRKIREALLAYQFDPEVSKSQILQMYLNEIFYGNLAYGVEAAVADVLREARRAT